jgi:hypothetical protein
VKSYSCGLLQQFAAYLVSADVCGAMVNATATSASRSAHGAAAFGSDNQIGRPFFGKRSLLPLS